MKRRHFVHRDRGFTMDMQFRGSRKMQTFRKEPISRPATPEEINRISLWLSSIRLFHHNDAKNTKTHGDGHGGRKGLLCALGVFGVIFSAYSSFIWTPS